MYWFHRAEMARITPDTLIGNKLYRLKMGNTGDDSGERPRINPQGDKINSL